MVKWLGLLDLTAKGWVQFLVGDLNSATPHPPNHSFTKQIGFERLSCMKRCWRYWGHNTDNILEKKISKESILQEINLQYSLEGLILMLKLQFFGPLI